MDKRISLLIGSLIAAFMCSQSGVAQGLSYEGEASQPCRTNTGVLGVLFKGHFNTIFTPENLETIHMSDWDGNVSAYTTVANEDITVFPDLRYGSQVLVYSSEQAQASRRTSIAFFDQLGESLGSCFVDVVLLDTSIYDFSKTRLGFCEFGEETGISQLTVGAAIVFDLPEKYSEGATSPLGVLEHSPMVGARQVELAGSSDGLATFIWSGDDTGEGALKGVCPLIVSDGT